MPRQLNLVLELEDPLTEQQAKRFAQEVFQRHPEVEAAAFSGNRVFLNLSPDLEMVGNPVPLIVYAVIGLATVIGVGVTIWYIRERVVPEIPEWVPYMGALGAFTLIALAVAWAAR